MHASTIHAYIIIQCLECRNIWSNWFSIKNFYYYNKTCLKEIHYQNHKCTNCYGLFYSTLAILKSILLRISEFEKWFMNCCNSEERQVFAPNQRATHIVLLNWSKWQQFKSFWDFMKQRVRISWQITFQVYILSLYLFLSVLRVHWTWSTFLEWFWWIYHGVDRYFMWRCWTIGHPNCIDQRTQTPVELWINFRFGHTNAWTLKNKPKFKSNQR